MSDDVKPATDAWIADWWEDLPALPTPWERRVTMMRARIAELKEQLSGKTGCCMECERRQQENEQLRRLLREAGSEKEST